jgi:hypothetical protein
VKEEFIVEGMQHHASSPNLVGENRINRRDEDESCPPSSSSRKKIKMNIAGVIGENCQINKYDSETS